MPSSDRHNKRFSDVVLVFPALDYSNKKINGYFLPLRKQIPYLDNKTSDPRYPYMHLYYFYAKSFEARTRLFQNDRRDCYERRVQWVPMSPKKVLPREWSL